MPGVIRILCVVLLFCSSTNGALTDLVCTEAGGVVSLSWVPGAMYGEVRIQRDGLLIATLAGAATDYIDPSPAGIPRVYRVSGCDVGGTSCGGDQSSCQTPEPLNTLRIPLATAGAGRDLVVDLVLDATENTTGFSYGLAHDPGVLMLGSVVQGVALTSSPVSGPDFFQVVASATSASGQVGHTVGCVYSFVGGVFLGAGARHYVVRITYLAATPTSTSASLEFSEALGNPPVSNDVAIIDPSFSPSYLGVGVTTIIEVPPLLPREFRRGDVNQDSVFDIADAVFLLATLFVPGSLPLECDDAADSNDDGVVNIADAIAILSELFIATAPPMPPPYPGCGVDPTVDSLLCAISSACP